MKKNLNLLIVMTILILNTVNGMNVGYNPASVPSCTLQQDINKLVSDFKKISRHNQKSFINQIINLRNLIAFAHDQGLYTEDISTIKSKIKTMGLENEYEATFKKLNDFVLDTKIDDLDFSDVLLDYIYLRSSNKIDTIENKQQAWKRLEIDKEIIDRLKKIYNDISQK